MNGDDNDDNNNNNDACFIRVNAVNLQNVI